LLVGGELLDKQDMSVQEIDVDTLSASDTETVSATDVSVELDNAVDSSAKIASGMSISFVLDIYYQYW